ncbi:unnamed protein product [Paramecium pentaurelia]|uniref:Uncharacterized protein n=1 Tax=Paramecium pentaurelia TaxID=43138 RepID=A0A8S1YRK4_9CILI|nr:unnamed protein product [Paramecium pentaurelia]
MFKAQLKGFKQSTVDEDKYLCMKCMLEKIDSQNIFSLEDTKIMIKEMRSEQLKKKRQRVLKKD